MKRKGLQLIIFVCIPIIFSIYVFFKCNDNNYALLTLLPLVYAITYLAFILIGKNSGFSIVKEIIVIGSYVRMVVIPVTIVLGNCTIWFGYYSTVISLAECERAMPGALLLMCYEQILLFAILALVLKNNKRMNSVVQQEERRKWNVTNGTLIYKLIIFCLIAFIVVFTFRYPSLGNYINFALSESAGASVNIQGNAPSVVYRLYTWFVDILQLIIPTACILFLKKSRMRKGYKLFCFLVVDFLTLCTMTQDKVLSIIYAFLLLIWFMQDYKKKPKLLVVGIGAIGVFGFFAFMQKNFIDRYTGEQQMIIFSGVLNAYFSGPYNVAASIVMSRSISISTVLGAALGDLLNSIPFFPVLFKGLNTTPTLFNHSIKGIDSVSSKIIPLIGQGYFYLSAVLAPVFSAIVVWIARRLETKMAVRKDSFAKFIFLYAAAFCALTPIMYNVNVLIKNLCNTAIIYFLTQLSMTKNWDNVE